MASAINASTARWPMPRGGTLMILAQRDFVPRRDGADEVGQQIADFLAVIKRHSAYQDVWELGLPQLNSKGRGCSFVRRIAKLRGSVPALARRCR